MRKESIKLPSGAEVLIRQLMMREENMLAQAARSRGNAQKRVMDDVIDACLDEWIDVGPYTGKEVGTKPKVREMLMGDKFAIMLELRCITYKDGHLFELSGLECETAGCDPYSFEINLHDDLIRRDLSLEDADVVANGGIFSCVVAGKTVSFNLANGDTENKYDKLIKQNTGRLMACLFRSRIVDVEGMERREILDWLDGNNGNSEKYEGLTGQECEELRDAMDLHECGIDTDAEIYCPVCGREDLIRLPFDSGFLMPSTEIQKRKRQRRMQKNSTTRRG